MLIYLVEDDPASRDALTRMLRLERHEIVAFSNAVEALNYLYSHPSPDVALIDYQLPGGPNGANLAQHIRLKFPNTAVIMISAYAGTKEVITAFRQGADDFLLRPIEPQELLHRIGEAILRRRPLYSVAESCRQVGQLRLDLEGRKAFWYDAELKLTPTELSLLTQLTARPGAVINYAELYSVTTGEHISPGEARAKLKSHVSNLKQKLQQAHPHIGTPIKTNRGFGFRWHVGGESVPDELEN